jgi:hypothetical protein
MEKSPSRKLINTSFVFLKDDGYYTLVDVMNRVDSAVLFTISYNLYGNFPNLSESSLKRYLKLRGLPDPNGFEIVDAKNSCYENTESVVFVRALTKKRWENREFDQVTINNLILNSTSREEKVRSLKNLKIKCGCKISNFNNVCRPSEYQRQIFRDERKHTDVPGSFIDTVFCKHGFISLDWLRVFYNTADFGIGPNPHIYNVCENVIKDVLKYKSKFPNYRLNTLYRDLLFRMYAPLKDLVWNS